MSDYTIWHNPKCSTSRFVLQALQDAGAEVEVRDYQAQPPTVGELRAALDRLGLAPRGLLRRRNTPHDELGLGDPALSDDALIAAMAEHPALIERPVVFGPKGARLCRPKEAVFDLLAP
ncbi:arsenate reductase (glutaredoxin) [Paracoccus benzoatiresistens]|uniref:Arsenate reductase n=1 Tax=Paracoccus benzoatiresistens TaxID=2997341 RepID=A0ABT4J1K9_9RHOB|nr:arsenate reductase (glutaredoxin) [Paracoccus sp. EF6]MCZ0960311.1 arsenate reductase (glutaredoxin) [Paracoccus sp. EF6]